MSPHYQRLLRRADLPGFGAIGQGRLNRLAFVLSGEGPHALSELGRASLPLILGQVRPSCREVERGAHDIAADSGLLQLLESKPPITHDQLVAGHLRVGLFKRGPVIILTDSSRY